MFRPMLVRVHGGREIGHRDLDLERVAAAGVAVRRRAVSLEPTHVAVDATWTPGAFGASVTVAASGPVE